MIPYMTESICQFVPQNERNFILFGQEMVEVRVRNRVIIFFGRRDGAVNERYHNRKQGRT
jgi:hypothetical protein